MFYTILLYFPPFVNLSGLCYNDNNKVVVIGKKA